MYGAFKTELRSFHFHLTTRTLRFLNWLSISRLLGCTSPHYTIQHTLFYAGTLALTLLAHSQVLFNQTPQASKPFNKFEAAACIQFSLKHIKHEVRAVAAQRKKNLVFKIAHITT